MGQAWRWLALLHQMLQWVATSLYRLPVKEAEKLVLPSAWEGSQTGLNELM